MALIIVEKASPEDAGNKISLTEGVLLIGRMTPENNPNIVLHDEYISRRHAEIIYKDNTFYIRDLNSMNGTSLDGVCIEAEKFYPLKQNSVIGLGITPDGARITLRFKESPTVSTTRIGVEKNNPVSWLKVDENRGEVRVDGKRLILSRKEYDFIKYLYENHEKVCNRDEIINRVWPEVVDPGGVSDAAIDQLVHRLRMKIEPDPKQPKRLLIRKGFGFRLV